MDSEEEYTRRVEALEIEIEKQAAILRGLHLEMGLEESLRQSFWLLEYEDQTLWAAAAVSETQHQILETFGYPIDGYTLLRRLSVEHERRKMAGIRHAGAKQRIARVRQEWQSNGEQFKFNKTRFAEHIAEREGVDFKTVYDRWLKGI